MRRGPSKAFLVCLTLLLASGGAAIWTWQKIHAVPDYVRHRLSLWELVTYPAKKKEYVLPSDEDRRLTRSEAEATVVRLTTQYPALKITEKPVPDDQNGFLLLYKFSQPPGQSRELMNAELKAFLAQPGKWDATIARRLAQENAASISEVEAIAAVPTRSSANMPDSFCGFIGARVAKSGVDLLMLKARLAAIDKNEPEALRLTALALNLGAHYREIETPNLLTETVAILIDLEVPRKIFTEILPALGPEADLGKWKAVMPEPVTPAAFAKVIRGEWNSSIRNWLLPGVLRANDPDHPPDPESVIQAYTRQFNDLVTRLPGMKLEEFLGGKGLSFPPIDPSLSPQSREIMSTLMIGSRAWGRGYARAACTIGQYQAALDLMIIEKEGKALVGGPVVQVPHDPVSEEPFTLDLTSRTLIPPAIAAKMDVKPLKLPW